MKRLRKLLQCSEGGQSMILVAILGSALMGTLGLAVEGGRIFVEYRHLQSAADMAAVVGAQGLPCGLLDTTCILAAETQGCDFATSNGFTGCTAGGSASPSANVPPDACSPYDFMDYGNGSTNSNCKTTTIPTFYDFIEVRLTDNLGVIPIFNIPVTLQAHAVAKRGTGSPADFALVQLDPSGTFSTGPLSMDGSASGNSSITGGAACGGGFFSSGTVSNVSTNDTGIPQYAPVQCSGGANMVNPVEAGGQPPTRNPYAGSLPPPTCSTTPAGQACPTANGNPSSPNYSGCPECNRTGWWWDLTNGGWNQGTPQRHVSAELFPGVYGTLPNGGGQTYNWVFNPGVYTFTNGWDPTTIRACVYGAPVCENTFAVAGSTCDTTTFAPNSSAGNQFYYACSQFGKWDSRDRTTGCSPTCPGASLPVNAPTWYDTATGLYTNVPLNGVTMYFPTGDPGLRGQGNSGQNWLAAPNPCPGNGSGSPPASSVWFPKGYDSSVYGTPSPPTSYPANYPYPVTWSASDRIYPSMDLSLLGECPASTHYAVWPGEMVKPQHLHFVFYIEGPNSSTSLQGGFDFFVFGIIYSPTSTWTERGNALRDGLHPPSIDGQLIAASVDLGGASGLSIAYRPCGTGSTACGSGPGTQLVQ